MLKVVVMIGLQDTPAYVGTLRFFVQMVYDISWNVQIANRIHT